MLTNKAHQIYFDFLISNTYLPDEHYPFLKYHKDEVLRRENNRVRNVQPESLTLQFKQ